jgi:hypothetical protein
MEPSKKEDKGKGWERSSNLKGGRSSRGLGVGEDDTV